MKIAGGKSEILGEKLAAMSLCPPVGLNLRFDSEKPLSAHLSCGRVREKGVMHRNCDYHTRRHHL
jgi:hypothetical protein